MSSFSTEGAQHNHPGDLVSAVFPEETTLARIAERLTLTAKDRRTGRKKETAARRKTAEKRTSCEWTRGQNGPNKTTRVTWFWLDISEGTTLARTAEKMLVYLDQRRRVNERR